MKQVVGLGQSVLQVIASIPGASQYTSAAILSSVTFDKDTEMFATAGVSKRIFIYNFENAAEAYGRDSAGQVVFLWYHESTFTNKLLNFLQLSRNAAEAV